MNFLLRFNRGDRVLIVDSSLYRHQNKDQDGNVYVGTVREKFKNSGKSDFNYIVDWDKGANSQGAYYNDSDLMFAYNFQNNKEASQLLSKEW